MTIQSIGRLAPVGWLISTLTLTAGLLWVPFTHAQGVGASGVIRGTVTDPTGGVIPNANVTAADPQTGLQRTAVTDSGGLYQFSGLPPSTYSVTVRTNGFATEVSNGVVVSIGETILADFHLSVSTVTAEVVVNETPPVIETTPGQPGEYRWGTGDYQPAHRSPRLSLLLSADAGGEQLQHHRQ